MLTGLYLQAYLAAVLIAVLLSPLVALGLLAGGLLIRRSHRIGLVRVPRRPDRQVGVPVSVEVADRDRGPEPRVRFGRVRHAR